MLGTSKFKGNREDLIEFIETNNKEKQLKSLVADVWKDIEAKCEVRRKKKYD